MEGLRTYLFLTLIVTGLAGCGGGGGDSPPPPPPPTDTTPPTVTSTDPYNTEVGTTLDTNMTITFSEELDPATVNNSSVLVSNNAGTVNGTVSLSMDGRTITFTPQSALAFNTRYDIEMTTAIEDLAGNPLASSYQWHFNTGKQLAAGFLHTCARLSDGGLKCWGNGFYGQLGYGDMTYRGIQAGQMGNNLPRVNLGAGRSARQIVTGQYQTCVRLDTRAVKCWGYNMWGQLGLGDTQNRGDEIGETVDQLPEVDIAPGRTVIEIAAGTDHNCARLDNGTMKCWGFNAYGELGYEDGSTRGDNPNEMGNNLPLIDLGTGRTAVEITAGNGHTCARLDNNNVKCWGYNEYGALGIGNTGHRGNTLNQMGDNLPYVQLGTNRTAVKIVATYTHSCAILDDASLKCWGFNNTGQLGQDDAVNRGTAMSEVGDSLPPIYLGSGRTAVDVVTGTNHTCAQLDDGSLKCWGYNLHGQLGMGLANTVALGDEAGEMAALPFIPIGTGRTVTELASSNQHNCVRLDNGDIKCWGLNASGGLGLGDQEDRGETAGETVAAIPAVDIGN